MGSGLFWLSDEAWRRIESHLPKDVRGKARVDDRRVISGILHVLKSGCRWSDCPPDYGPPTTIYNRFVRWAERGVWEHLFRKLAPDGLATRVPMIDSACAKVRERSAPGAKKVRKSRRSRARAAGTIRKLAQLQMLEAILFHPAEPRSAD